MNAINGAALNNFFNNKFTGFDYLSRRLDYDRVVTTFEALNWYHKGGGNDLFVDASKFDFISSNLTVKDFKYADKNSGILQVNFFTFFNSQNDNKSIIWRPGSATLSNVYDTLRRQLVNPKDGTIKLVNNPQYNGGFDGYDFNGKTKWIADHLGRGIPNDYNFHQYGIPNKIRMTEIAPIPTVISRGTYGY